MEIFRNLIPDKSFNSSILTIGSYDGLHRGHQEIIKQAVAHAKATKSVSVVITFHPHPKHVVVVDESNKLPLLMGIDEKIDLLKLCQVDAVHIIPFSNEFSKMEPDTFLDEIVLKYYKPHHIIVGYNHHFGYRRKGSPDFLKRYFKNKSTKITVVEPFSDEGSVISSSKIRSLITEGYIRRASFELGWVYSFHALVVHGSGRGLGLKFPTANFIPVEINQLLPKNGVYLTRGRVDGQQLYGMCNLGVRPTFGEGDFVMEVHFFHDFDLDIYGRIIKIEFLERIRDEKRFSDEKELTKQLNNDRLQCKSLLSKYK